MISQSGYWATVNENNSLQTLITAISFPDSRRSFHYLFCFFSWYHSFSRSKTKKKSFFGDRFFRWMCQKPGMWFESGRVSLSATSSDRNGKHNLILFSGTLSRWIILLPIIRAPSFPPFYLFIQFFFIFVCINIYIYIYVCVCACVCACVFLLGFLSILGEFLRELCSTWQLFRIPFSNQWWSSGIVRREEIHLLSQRRGATNNRIML